MWHVPEARRAWWTESHALRKLRDVPHPTENSSSCFDATPKNSLQYNAVLKITKGDSAIEMEHEDKMPDGQSATYKATGAFTRDP